jgi:hypothetical protein
MELNHADNILSYAAFDLILPPSVIAPLLRTWPENQFIYCVSVSKWSHQNHGMIMINMSWLTFSLCWAAYFNFWDLDGVSESDSRYLSSCLLSVGLLGALNGIAQAKKLERLSRMSYATTLELLDAIRNPFIKLKLTRSLKTGVIEECNSRSGSLSALIHQAITTDHTLTSHINQHLLFQLMCELVRLRHGRDSKPHFESGVPSSSPGDDGSDFKPKWFQHKMTRGFTRTTFASMLVYVNGITEELLYGDYGNTDIRFTRQLILCLVIKLTLFHVHDYNTTPIFGRVSSERRSSKHIDSPCYFCSRGRLIKSGIHCVSPPMNFVWINSPLVTLSLLFHTILGAGSWANGSTPLLYHVSLWVSLLVIAVVTLMFHRTSRDLILLYAVADTIKFDSGC